MTGPKSRTAQRWVRARGAVVRNQNLNQIVGKSWKRLAIIASKPTHCLELARLMSDPHAARILRSAAGRHFEQASELEKLTVTSPSIAPEK